MNNLSVHARLAAVALFAAATLVFAQTKSEETIQTDTVDLFKQPETQSKKSAALAMFGSILLPGLGHQYLGMQDHAMPYFAAEALFVFGAIFCEQYSKRMTENSHLYTFTYANARGGDGANDAYWQAVGDFSDLKGFNQAQELNGTNNRKYVSPDLSWDWLDDSYRNEYLTIRQNATKFQVASTFFIGAMVIDRVIAFVDTRTSMKFGKVRKQSALSVTPQLASDLSSAGAVVSYRF